MRAHIMSDLHFEHMARDNGDEFFRRAEALKVQDPAGLLILAGDICQVGRHESFWKSCLARLCGTYDKVLYVPGNHEYYSSCFESVDRFMSFLNQDPNLSNLIQLSQGPYEYEGIRFIGDTMWFPDTGETRWTKRMMSDFFTIGSQSTPFEPNVYGRHQDFLTKVMGKLKVGDVVVSHHMPLPASIHPKYNGSPINCFFMSDMTQHLREDCLPRLWIHGHTHEPLDYGFEVGAKNMRIYCNPFGYPNEGTNNRFWDRVGIDL